MLNNFAELVVRELERDQVYHQQLKEADMSHSQVCPAALTWLHCIALPGRGQLQQDNDSLCMPYRAVLAWCAICLPLKRH